MDAIRLFVQGTDFSVIECVKDWREYGWNLNTTLWDHTPKALPGSSIAAVTGNSKKMCIFYQGSNNAIYERRYTPGWDSERLVFGNAMPLTALSAVSSKSTPFLLLNSAQSQLMA
jgi:hypothetical protein